MGRAISEPTATHSSRVPIWPEVMCRVSVTAGMRAAQLANTSPLMPKIRKVAAAAALSCGPVAVWSYDHCFHRVLGELGKFFGAELPCPSR